MYFNFLITDYFVDLTYVAVITIIMIYIFLVFTFFVLLNTFDAKYIKNLSDLKKMGVVFPFNLLFLILILSFAGVPPLFGFSVKLILFMLIINGTAVFYIFVLAIFNFFTLYFYVQNVRYVINNSSNNFYVYMNHVVHISETTMFLLLSALLLNMGGILYLSDILIFFMNFVV